MPEAPEVIELAAGAVRLGVAPEVGGSITRYATARGESNGNNADVIEWMRPAPAEALAERSAGGTSSFPMVPFSNRIGDARFRFQGRTVRLPQTSGPSRMPCTATDGVRHGWCSTARRRAC